MRKSTFPSRNDVQKSYSKFLPPFSWPPSIPTIIPHRIRRKLRSKVRSRQSPSTTLSHLNTSYSPADTIESLRLHRWSFFDGQYLILIILAIFSLCIIPSPGPLVKTALSTLIITALILPVTRQFLLPSLPIWSWLVFFYACGYEPPSLACPFLMCIHPLAARIVAEHIAFSNSLRHGLTCLLQGLYPAPGALQYGSASSQRSRTYSTGPI